MSDLIELENFLEDCDDSQSLGLMEHFQNNGITSIQVLRDIAFSEIGDDFKELVPSMGTRAKIKRLLTDAKNLVPQVETTLNCQQNAKTDDNGTDFTFEKEAVKEDGFTEVSDITESYISEFSGDISSSSKINEEPPNKYIILETLDVPQMVSVKNYNVDQECHIKLSLLLEETVVGRAIKCIYQRNKQLDSRCQSYLVDIIVQHCVNRVPFRRLNNSDFNALAKEIVKVFPNEVPEVYYTPPISKKNSRTNKCIISRGKLIDKYRNKLSFLRKAKCLPETGEPDDSTFESQDDVHSGQDDLTWLRNNEDPWTAVIEKWQNTFTYRQAFLKTDVTLAGIILEFPIIQNALGHTLIDLDFQKRYPESHGKLFHIFEDVFFKLLEIRKKHLSPADNLILELIGSSSDENKDSRHFLMLNLIVSLLPSKSQNKKCKSNWHPTTTESKEGLIVQIKTLGDLENVVEKRRELMKKYGLPMLPFVIVEAPTYTEIKNIYVSFESISYKLVSILKAVDICFELIHVLNLLYPFESEHIWMFIQLAMYGLKTKYDNIPNIIDMVNKVNVLRR